MAIGILFGKLLKLMGMCIPREERYDKEQKNKAAQKQQQPKLEDADLVKVKLKQARDKIKNFIAAKNKDIYQIDDKIKDKIPEYQQTGNKKQLVPLLKAKKDLETMVDNADVRLKLVNEKIAEVELQKLNVETIKALDESNQYIKEVQKEMEEKDWRNVLDEAQNKYELEWPDDREEVEEDPAFQEMWNQLGGNKIPAKKQVAVNVAQQKQQEQNRQVQMA